MRTGKEVGDASAIVSKSWQARDPICLVVVAAGMAPAWGDDTGILGRLFRLGGGSSDASPSTSSHRARPGRFLMAALPARPNGAVPPARNLAAIAGTDGLEF